MTKEKMFENEIRDFLNSKKIYHFKFWGGNLKVNGRFVRTKAGVPDLICCINGLFFCIEVKQENGEVSEIQKKNICEINRNGGFAVVCFPKDFELLKITINNLLLTIDKEEIDRIRHQYYSISQNI